MAKRQASRMFGMIVYQIIAGFMLFFVGWFADKYHSEGVPYVICISIGFACFVVILEIIYIIRDFDEPDVSQVLQAINDLRSELRQANTNNSINLPPSSIP